MQVTSEKKHIRIYRAMREFEIQMLLLLIGFVGCIIFRKGKDVLVILLFSSCL